MLALSVAALAATGCTGSSVNPTAVTATKVTVPLPAGKYPSKISKMVCSAKAGHDIGGAVGAKATIEDITWVQHRYSCQYHFSTGSMTLSVQEVSSWPETTDYFTALANSMGVAQQIYGLGQGAFQATNGSVVVRKDWKILVVDPTGLPAQLGKPAVSPTTVALRATYQILGCWNGD